MAEILITYSTTDGHTLEICQHLKQVIERLGHHVCLQSIDASIQPDLENFDKIVVGASIRYGKHSKAVYQFIEKHRQSMDRKPNAFFSVNLVARKPEKRQPHTNPYVRKFLKEIPWHPKEMTVFAGKLNYPIYSFWDRQIIRLIMWMTKGPTDPTTVIDYTDWDQVESFAELISAM